MVQVEATSAQLTVAAAYAAARQPALALPHVLNALYHATALHLDGTAAAAAVALAEIKLSLSPTMASEARALVEVTPPPPSPLVPCASAICGVCLRRHRAFGTPRTACDPMA